MEKSWRREAKNDETSCIHVLTYTHKTALVFFRRLPLLCPLRTLWTTPFARPHQRSSLYIDYRPPKAFYALRVIVAYRVVFFFPLLNLISSVYSVDSFGVVIFLLTFQHGLYIFCGFQSFVVLYEPVILTLRRIKILGFHNTRGWEQRGYIAPGP